MVATDNRIRPVGGNDDDTFHSAGGHRSRAVPRRLVLARGLSGARLVSGRQFGIFVHWGAYSVPVFGNEWYPRNMYVQGSPEYEYHREVYGDHERFGYKDLIDRFTAERFDPQQWAELFR